MEGHVPTLRFEEKNMENRRIAVLGIGATEETLAAALLSKEPELFW
jgi:hypothetical protein